MSNSKHKKLERRKRKILDRLAGPMVDQGHPMLTASNIGYELADRVRGLSSGGIGAIHLLARKTGLIKAIDRRCTCLSCICLITNRVTC